MPLHFVGIAVVATFNGFVIEVCFPPFSATKNGTAAAARARMAGSPPCGATWARIVQDGPTSTLDGVSFSTHTAPSYVPEAGIATVFSASLPSAPSCVPPVCAVQKLIWPIVSARVNWTLVSPRLA